LGPIVVVPLALLVPPWPTTPWPRTKADGPLRLLRSPLASLKHNWPPFVFLFVFVFTEGTHNWRTTGHKQQKRTQTNEHQIGAIDKNNNKTEKFAQHCLRHTSVN